MSSLATQEIEMAALGSMMLSKLAAKEVAGIVDMGMFYFPAHKALFNVMNSMLGAGLEMDLVTIKHELVKNRSLKTIGGIEYLIQVAESVATAAHSGTYARQVREDWAKRELKDRCLALAKDANDLHPDEFDGRVNLLMAGMGGFNVCHVRGDELNPDAETIQGVKTPYRALNEAIEDCGGLPRGQVTGVVATKKGGKTSLMLSLAWKTVQELSEGRGVGKRVAYVTLADLTPSQLQRRIIRQVTGLGRKPLFDGGMFDQEKFDQLTKTWERAAYDNAWSLIHFYDGNKRFGGDIHKICSWLESEHERSPWEQVFIDYYQKLKTGEKDRVRDLEKASSHVASCAARLEIPSFVMGSQVSSTGMTRYSQELEDDAGLIIRASRDKLQNGDIDPSGASTFDLPYNRFGPSCLIPVFWNERRLMYQEEI